ncbi:MAG: flavodoxin [Clostridiaceae bacterium]|nr:flavodoxin [Clostridiaceae bacterium]
MNKITIVYWSLTGNTEKMARLIKKGAESAGAEVKIKHVSEASEDDLKDSGLLALGCPAMGVEELEENEFEPYVSSIESMVFGKKLALFGSYGWGDGEWMRNFSDRMRKNGAVLLGEGLIVKDSPQGADEERCIAFGIEAAGF